MTSSYWKRLRSLMKGMMFRHMPYMISCVEFEDFISSYFEGSLPRAQLRVFQLHLRFCRECREYLQAYQETIEIGRSVFDDPGAQVPGDVPEDLVKAILDARDR